MMIVQFEHQTNAPVAYPNYFKSKTWTDSLLALTENWLHTQFNASVVDYKKLEPISFVPIIDYERPIRSIRSTAYDLALSIVSRLEAEGGETNPDASQAIFRVDVQLLDKDQRVIYKNKLKVPVQIAEDADFPGEVYLPGPDFRQIYEEALRAALYGEAKPQAYRFEQASHNSLQAFLEQAARLDFQLVEPNGF
ncbi:MAG: hypothetical protein HC880_08370 [Bacteroidia bacterium]|nr:hypothetical protein [Bacteroidia bacterium]